MTDSLIDEAPPGRSARVAAGPWAGGRMLTLVVTLVVAVADQASKQLSLAVLGDGTRVLGPVRFTVVHNAGGPFGIGTSATSFWTVVSAAVVTGIVVVAWSGRPPLQRAWPIGAVVGGGAGNLFDRLVRTDGAVVDWIAVEPYPRVFNLADVALRLGALAMVAGAFRRRTPTG